MDGSPKYILGISAFYHDSAACLLRDGGIIAAAQEERFSRIKHDPSYPAAAIEYCLAQAGIEADQLGLVAFYEKPFIKFERLLETYLSVAPRGLGSFLKALPVWLRQKLWIKDRIRRQLGYDGRILFPEHHLSHAAAAFFPSPFESAAILTIDGVGEQVCAGLGIGEGNQISLLATQQFPHSLGLLYSAFTYFCGFKVNSGEYKLMGLAPYGEPKYRDVILDRMVDLRRDGSLRLDLGYFDFLHGLKMTSGRFDDLFGGPPRRPESEITTREMDLASSIQAVTELAILRLADHAHRETGRHRLCLAGGVALNCVANACLLRDGPFDEIWIQPAAGDAGGALGAALSAWHQYLGEDRSVVEGRDSQKGSLLGPSYTADAIEAALDKRGLVHRRASETTLCEETAKLLGDGKTVGWFQGRMEFGPRALGNRSILGDARSPSMQRTMNLKIKNRESFRPFAPAVLEESAGDYFDIDRPSPYMLLTAPVTEAQRLPTDEDSRTGLEKLDLQRSRIPAVTHVDYSARLQTVNATDNPRFHRLLTEFDRQHGCPVLINTSFNVRGEPIVCSPDDAIDCFLRTAMDVLVLDTFIVNKENPGETASGLQPEFELD
ncbi:MAG: carbamoyltransferase [bacterium]